MKNSITIVGGGYVGMAYAGLLSEKNDVTVVDKSQERVEAILNRECAGSGSPHNPVRATSDGKATYAGADYVIIAIPTDLSEGSDELDCLAVEEVIGDVLNVTDHALIVIKSTVPVGFTESCARKYDTDRIIYNPEFLRENSAFEDCRNPGRIVVGIPSCIGRHDEDCDIDPTVETYVQMLTGSMADQSVNVLSMISSEAEAVKLFSNTYLAMRVAFFNELDSFAEATDLDPETVIRGVCADPRIGDRYNIPSFGYGGTCLPKDVRQLRSQVRSIHGDLISSIDASNRNRHELIVDRIAERLTNEGSVAGIYCLSMEAGSDNYRRSCVLEVLEGLLRRGITTVIYEPALKDEKHFMGCEVIDDLDSFKKTSDIIITNRYDPVLEDVREKVYTRDATYGINTV